MVGGAWLVIVDVAPSTVRVKADRVLRNLGFVEILPCIYRSHWFKPERSALERTLRGIRRKGVGRIAIGRLDRKGLMIV